jgi:DNA-directed RNA polymerase subunit RPC12/RpoP
MARRFGGRRFGTKAQAVTSNSMLMPERKDKRTGKTKSRKCRACRAILRAGEPVIKLTLKKKYRGLPCATCGHKLVGVKWFHAGCAPADINKAMGYAPQAQAPVANGGAVPPPPKPLSSTDLTIAALVAVEKAFNKRLAENPALQKDPAVDAALRTYDGCKQRFLRPGTAGEGAVAMKMSLKKVLDLVF